MQKNVSRRAGKRAIASLIAGVMISTGTVAVTTPAVAQTAASAPTESVTGDKPKGPVDGMGSGTLHVGSVEPGGLLTFSGEGFPDRSGNEDAFFGVKLNDGLIPLPAEQDGASEGDVDGSGVFNLTGGLPGADGKFEAKVRVPKDLKPGAYFLRVLGGQDGGEGFSKWAWFTVTDPDAGSTDNGSAAEAQLAATVASGTGVDVKASGFDAGEEVSATLDGKDVQFAQGRRGSVATLTAGENGSLEGSLRLSEGALPAGKSGQIVLTGKNSAKQVKAEVSGVPDVAVATEFGSTPAMGSTAEITISNLTDGTALSALGAGDANFLAAGQTARAAGGKITLDKVEIPNDAKLLDKVLYVDLQAPGADQATRYETSVKVTPDNAVKNAEDFDIAAAELPSGLYQSAYSAKENSVYVTRSVGRPPLKETSLIKVNADTLEVEKEITPESAGASGLYGTYGVDVDDARDRVWVTNTRQNTVSVYKASDLSLIHRFEDGSANHARDVKVDPSTGLAYVSTPRGGTSTIEVFDLDGKSHSSIDLSGQDFGGTMSLDLDKETGELFTVSLDKPKAAKIDVRNGNQVTVYDLGEGNLESGSGIAWDSANRNLHITGQGTANDLVYNVDKQAVVANIPTGAGALNTDYNAATGLVYVSNFGADTVSVIDATSLKLVANLSLGGRVNHVQSGKDGNVYAVTKSAIDKDGKTYNKLVKVSKKNSAPTKEPKPGSSQGSSLDGKVLSQLTRAITGLAGALGIAVAVTGVLQFVVSHGIIPRNLIPAGLRKYL